MTWKMRLRLRLLGCCTTAPISRCVHFGAFRYGREEPHPYESYARKLVQNGDRLAARGWLLEFLQHYRPRNFGEAIGVQLQETHGLWHFPWLRMQPENDGWFSDPVGFPDIVTQFCPEGVLWFRIEQEFFWLERAIYSIRLHGFRPEKGDPITALRLLREDGEEAFLILDGNHRISALAALGTTSVDLCYFLRDTVRERDVARWPQVRSGRFSESDARKVFHAYFQGNPSWRTTEQAAPLLECPTK